MKKIIMLFSFILMTSSSFASLEFGGKIGYNATTISIDKEQINESYKSGGQFGAFLRLGNGSFFIQPELMYTMKGAFIEKSGEKNEVPLNTIDIPIILGYKLNTESSLQFNVQAGVCGSLLTEKSVEYTISEVENSKLSSFLLSGQVGAGMDILMFTLDLRYEFGLNNLYEQDAALNDYIWKSNRFSVTLGIKI